MQMKIFLPGLDRQAGWELQRSLAPLGKLVATRGQQADLSRHGELRALGRDIQLSVIVNASAYTAVGKAEIEIDMAHIINVESVGVLLKKAHRLGAWLVLYWTDYALDGATDSVYTEDEAKNLLSTYGRVKLEGEQLVLHAQAKHLSLRTSWVYVARRNNFVKAMLIIAKEREELKVGADQYGASTSAELIADIAALALYCIHACSVADGFLGTYHLAASGETNWHQYAQYVLGLAHAKSVQLEMAPAVMLPISSSAHPLPVERPKNSRLSTAKRRKTFGVHLPASRYHVTRPLSKIPL